MESLLNILKVLLLGALILGPSGCATTDADLGYSRKTIADPSADSSYHGWNSAPQETSQ